MSLMASLCAVLFQREVWDEIWDLIESVSEGFLPTLVVTQNLILRQRRACICRISFRSVQTKLLYKTVNVVCLLNKHNIVKCFFCWNYDIFIIGISKFRSDIRIFKDRFSEGFLNYSYTGLTLSRFR